MTYRARLSADLNFMWTVWLSNGRFWALSPLLLVAGLWVIGSLFSPPADWVVRICQATDQERRVAAWCARNDVLYVRGECVVWPAVFVAATAVIGVCGAMSVVIALASVR